MPITRVVMEMMKWVHRLISIGLILSAVSGFAYAEIKNQQEIEPRAYTLKIGSDSYIVITPFDKNQSVFITKRGTHKNAIVEGIPGRVISQAAKMFASKPGDDINIRRLIKKVISSKEKYLSDKNTLIINLKPNQVIDYIR